MQQANCFIAVEEQNEDGTFSANLDGPIEYSLKEYGDFYTAIGECLAVWAKIEIMLYFIYSRCVYARFDQALAHSYESASGFRAKLDMVNAAACNTEVPGVDLTWWEQLKIKLQRCAGNRNKIAHYQVFYLPSGPANRRFFISHHTKANALSSRLYCTDLNQICTNFQEMVAEIQAFDAAILEANKPKETE